MLILKVVTNIYLSMVIANDKNRMHKLLIMNCEVPFF